jgi:arylsulfatase A-like enzyme
LTRNGLARCAALLCAAACLACHRTAPRPSGPLSILLITVDTLRADHLGLYGYERKTSPNVDRWFADGWVFERAYATETSTSPSVVSILSGVLPQRHGVRLFYQRVPDTTATAADLLRARGYQTAAVVSNVVLTDEAIGLAARFDDYDDFVDEKESRRPIWQRSAKRTTDAALQWLVTRRDPRRPHFLWVHYIDPHGPYEPPADAPRRFRHSGSVPVDSARILDYQRDPAIKDARDYEDRYDEEIAYCDREIGRLLEGYEKHVSVASSLLIFAADHGEMMAEHEFWFTHSYDVYEGMAHVPLTLRIPGQSAARFFVPVSLVDVLPTMLDLAGVPVPAGLDGNSLLRFASGPPASSARPVYVEATNFAGTAQRRALIQGNHKWIEQLRRPEGAVMRRYRIDLDEDPGETRFRDWEKSDSARVAPLEALVSADPDPAGMPREYSRGHKLATAKVRPDVSPEVREKLRALGYLSD